MILLRALRVVGVAGILACGHLARQATPWGGKGWARGRLLCAAARAMPALALPGISALGRALRRQAREIAILRETPARIDRCLRA